MPPSRYIRLTDEEDVRLREIEQAPYFEPKVRLRAQVLRLSHRGSNVQTISAYTGRSRASIGRDLDRWKSEASRASSMGGLRATRGASPRRRRTFMEGKLSEERTWNATQLAEALAESFGVEVTPEAVRQRLRSMGYSWKRTRYVPSKAPDPDEEREAAQELEALKKGLEKESSS